jgi:hypothetical protein
MAEFGRAFSMEQSMSFAVKKLSLLAAAATLAAGFSVAPISSAEAQWRGHRGHHHHGYRHHRVGPGLGVAAGIAGAAILGGALLAPRAYGHPYYAPAYGGPVYEEPLDCYVVQRRVWDEYRGRFVRVRERVCE